MSLHLMKLAVGCDSVADLTGWIKQRIKQKKARGEKPEHIHTTRMVPKRTDELLDGGSLYWVIRGQIACREELIAIRPFVDKDGIGRCRLVLRPKVIVVEPRFAPFRAGAICRPRMRPATLIALRPARAICPKSCGASCAIWGCSKRCRNPGKHCPGLRFASSGLR
jgi:hypothetical protein